MGVIADMICDGILCQCGQYIDDDSRTVGPDGYPRFCYDCGGDPDTNYAAKRNRNKPNRKKRPSPCPVCHKRLKSEQGVRDHIRDMHNGGAL